MGGKTVSNLVERMKNGTNPEMTSDPISQIIFNAVENGNDKTHIHNEIAYAINQLTKAQDKLI